MINCKKCKNECKPSKAFINYHKYNEYKATYKVTKLVDCLKCIKCGHSFIPE